MEKRKLYQPAQDCDESLQEQALPLENVDSGDGFSNDASPSTATTKRLHYKRIGRATTKAVAYTAVMTALVYVGTIIGFSSQAFYFNLGDSVILICAALFNPICAMLAGGLGAFFGDLTVYPATMLFTLIIKAVEGLLAGVLFKLINRWFDKKSLSAIDEKQRKRAYILKIVFSCLASLLSVIVMMLGYFMCQSLFYGTVTSAQVALPFDLAQGAISLAVANLALYALKLDNFRSKLHI
ncbi:MAG: ECF transporter S component [Clostridia bacterium]|nr:ECF transporter S component [Clostridia bacterium]